MEAVVIVGVKATRWSVWTEMEEVAGTVWVDFCSNNFARVTL